MYVRRTRPAGNACAFLLSPPTPLPRSLATFPTSTSSSKRKNPTQRFPKDPTPKFSHVLADVPHNVSPILDRLDLPVRHELYARFCISLLKDYGIQLKLSRSSGKWSTGLEGCWSLGEGKSFNVQASCSLISDLSSSRAVRSSLLEGAPENTINIIINNLGFKSDQIKLFVASETPTLLLSVFDSSPHWMQSNVPKSRHRKVQVQRHLHTQKWDRKVGFSTYSFNKEQRTIPESVLNQGLSLVLLNRALTALAPGLSAGKVVYNRSNKDRKVALRAQYASTILYKDATDDKVRCLRDVVAESNERDRMALRESLQDLIVDKGGERYFSGVTRCNDIGTVFSSLFLDNQQPSSHSRRNSWP